MQRVVSGDCADLVVGLQMLPKADEDRLRGDCVGLDFGDDFTTALVNQLRDTGAPISDEARDREPKAVLHVIHHCWSDWILNRRGQGGEAGSKILGTPNDGNSEEQNYKKFFHGFTCRASATAAVCGVTGISLATSGVFGSATTSASFCLVEAFQTP